MKILAITAMIAACFVYCNQSQPTPAANAPITQDSLIKKGAYLVNMMGCADCHSPKVMGPQGPHPDPERFLSGHPANEPVAQYDSATITNWVLFNMGQTATVGPWGITFAANITSDSTGIGSWSEEQFFKAIRFGKYKGLDNSRPLMPPMPWPMYAKANDEDLKAIFAFLKSTKPVKNVVPQAMLNPPPPPLAAK